jgi:hypothetical protein
VAARTCAVRAPSAASRCARSSTCASPSGLRRKKSFGSRGTSRPT